jgi:3-hydroxybutyryl-CoA dehydratase
MEQKPNFRFWEAADMAFHDLTIGQTASIQKTFSAADITVFAGASLDVNPVHMSDKYAEGTIFGKRVVHGILTAGLISAVIGNYLPGPGSIYLGQELKFTAPVYLGDDITAEVEIVEIREDKKIIKLDTTCYNQDGKKVITGLATVKFDG